MKWVTFEDPHLAEFKDPPYVERAAPGKTLPQMLLDGELDAGIVGDHMPDPRLKYLIPNPEEEAKKWALSHGGVPINHLVVMRESMAKARPDIVKESIRPAASEQAGGKLPRDRHRARSAALRCRGQPAGARRHHRLRLHPGHDPAPFHGRRIVRRRDAVSDGVSLHLPARGERSQRVSATGEGASPRV